MVDTMLDDHVILHEDALDELYSWIDEVPLSRPKKNIARDFADGVLCAEVIAHFMSKAVDMHNYFCAHSLNQKKVNWNTLNRKVFPKLGMKLSDATIQYLVDGKPGCVEQVLWDIRRRMQDTNSGARYHEPNPQRLRKSYSGRTLSSTNASSGSGGGVYYANRSSPSHEIEEYNGPESIPIHTSMSHTRTTAGGSGSYHKLHAPAASSSISNSSYRNQGYIAPPTLGGNNNYSNSALIPTQITYRGQKMVPLSLLEEKERELKNVEQTNKSLTTKVHRIETLVNVKDQRIEDLTHQLHNLRKMYERATQSTWTGYQ